MNTTNSSYGPEYSASDTLPIAVIGMSCRFPGGSTNPEKLWEMLSEGRDGWSEGAKDRFNMTSFYHPVTEKSGSAMEPAYRFQLELAYEAMENAGLSLNKVSDSNMGVFVGIYNSDYERMLLRDSDSAPFYTTTGTGHAMLANRISYFYNLKGPSFGVDTGCSGSLVAMHLACQSLLNGECKSAIVGGAGLILAPDTMLSMSSLKFFSPEGRCFAFDSRGNGYGRGEGAGCVIIKLLSDALRDGDPIRAIIRGSGINSDGQTPGITMPNGKAQEDLMRAVYAKANLDPKDTSYVEAHGTGTPAGDPIEAAAVANVHFSSSKVNPLFIGSIKTNIGHLEGASGIAGFIKAVLVLEKGFIPPSLNFKQARDGINFDKWNMRIPLQLEPFPSNSTRRASVNSFGYGGSNAFCVIDNATDYLSQANIDGYSSWGHLQVLKTFHDNASEKEVVLKNPKTRLFVLSAETKDSLKAIKQKLAKYLLIKCLPSDNKNENDSFVEKLAYTLCLRRSQLTWRSSHVAKSLGELIESLESQQISRNLPLATPTIGFVFTGMCQGAFHYAMGRELIATYPVFKNFLSIADKHFTELGAKWSIFDELSHTADSSSVPKAAISQPLCTALQIALVQLLASWNIKPAAITGHSSGEIAAAYAFGALSFEDALTVAYFRGYHSSQIAKKNPLLQGAMLAVALSESETSEILSETLPGHGRAVVACINSQSSVTVSGDESAITKLKQLFDSRNIFSRRLMVDVAYHSHHMELIADAYLASISKIQARAGKKGISFWSSVSGDVAFGEDLDAGYWVRNLVSPVRFSDALAKLCLQALINKDFENEANISPPISNLIEIGPHSALKGPIETILQQPDLKLLEIKYDACLIRNVDACKSMLNLSGHLFAAHFPIEVDAVNFPQGFQLNQVLTDLPTYEWDHSTRYWHESRIDAEYRLRSFPRHDLLGSQVPACTTLEPIWRNHIRVSELPWVKGHVIQSKYVYPGAGYIAMAIEASAQIARTSIGSKRILGYSFRDIQFAKALIIPETIEGIETIFSLRPSSISAQDSSENWKEFRIFSYLKAEGWSENCRGIVATLFHTELNDVEEGRAVYEERKSYLQMLAQASNECCTALEPQDLYEELSASQLEYSHPFRGIEKCSIGSEQCLATIKIPDTEASMPGAFQQPHTIHPATLDACFQTIFPVFLDSLHKTRLPIKIEKIFISADIKSEATCKFQALSITKTWNALSSDTNIFVFDADETTGKPVIVVSSLSTTTLASKTDSSVDGGQTLCHNMQWIIDPDYLSDERAVEICAVKVGSESVIPMVNALSQSIIRATLDALTEYDPVSPHHKRLYNWMKCYESKIEEPSKDLKQRLLKIQREQTKPVCSVELMLRRIGDSYPQIIRAEVEPLSVMIEGNLLSQVYKEFGLRCDTQLAEFLSLLIQKSPGLRILEIGAGTASSTLTLLNSLQSANPKSKDLGIDTYDFTDISTAFFEKAQELLKTWESFINFKKLDIESDPKLQGFEEESYDLIVASNVIHATRSLKTTLGNVRQLLRPGGRLALIEITNNSLFAQVIFGTLPGWWLGVEDGRVESPLLDVPHWNEILMQNEFSGVDVQLSDYKAENERTMTLMISSKQDDKTLKQPNVLIINDATEGASISTVTSLRDLVDPAQLSVGRLEDVTMDNKICIFVYEMDRPFLYDCSEAQFNKVLNMLKTSAGVLWVTAGATMDCMCPEASIIHGLARSARSENLGLKLVTLDLDLHTRLRPSAVAQIIWMIVQRNFFLATNSVVESEYSERQGTIYIPRLFESSAPTIHIRRAAGEQRLETLPFFDPERKICLQIATPGLLDTLHWNDQRRLLQSLGPDEIEMTTRAAGLNFRDVMIAMGQLPSMSMDVGEYSGIVTAVGSNVTMKYKVGDRICAVGNDVCANTLRIDALSCHHIPNDMSFETAASIPIIYVTAYYCLSTVARLQKNETILIHSGAGGVGQASIMLSQHIGATVFVTVGNGTKKKFIMEKFGIPESRIFSSRATTFVDSIKRLTSGKGVDVVLNSLSGDALRETFSCVAPFGRFIEIGKKDILTNGKLDMRMLLQNVSFMAVDISPFLSGQKEMVQKLLQDCFSLLEKGKVHPVSPLTIFPISDIEAAFRQVQQGKHLGKIILQADEGCMVKMSPPPFSPKPFAEDCSYLIVGGFGGIGREICRWMCKLKAKHIIIISRSGLGNHKSNAFAAELRAIGVNFAGYACNVSVEKELSEVLELCKLEMPPIRGVIHCGMQLKDSTLDNMSYQDFRNAIDPKVMGTLNLYKLLCTQLEFIILLSSIAGIFGSPGQSNYAAGNTFQDAFAGYASSQGLKTISLDLGLVGSVGYASENKEMLSNYRDLIPMKVNEILALIDFTKTMEFSSFHSRQIISGLTFNPNTSIERLRMTLSDSKFSHLLSRRRLANNDSQTTNTRRWSTILYGTTSLKESTHIICLALKDKLAKTLLIDLKDISESESISRLGADSLVAVELRNWILLELKAEISLLDILEPRPITEFALIVAKSSQIVLHQGQHLENIHQNRTSNISPPIQISDTNKIRKIIDTCSTELRSWPISPMATDTIQSQNEVILLTGATGSIGAVLLDILCSSSKVLKVYAIVRGDNGYAKLQKSFKRQRLDKDILSLDDKVEVLKYEMTDQFLGLEQTLYKRLSREVTTVIHLAWILDFINNIGRFQECIKGTMNLLRFCVLGRLKCFSFASSVSVYGGRGPTKEIVQESVIDDDDNSSSYFPMGYAQSKYIVERITRIGSEHHGIPIRILRIGQVCGHSKFGYWDPRNTLPILFRVATLLDTVTDLSMHIDWIPSDIAAQAIHDIVTSPIEEPYTVYNIVNPHPIPWPALYNILYKAGLLTQSYKTLPLRSWIMDMENAKDEMSPTLLPFLKIILEDGYFARTFVTDRTRSVSPTFASCPPFNEDWMKLYVEIWRRDGFLPATSNSHHGSVHLESNA